MPNELEMIGPEIGASSVYVDGQRWSAWLATQREYQATLKAPLYAYLARDLTLGTDGTAAKIALFNNLKASVKAFCTAYARDKLGNWLVPSFVLDNMINTVQLNSPTLNTLVGMTASQAKSHLYNSDKNQKLLEGGMTAFANTARSLLLSYWAFQVLAPQAPTPAPAITDALDVKGSAGVSCAVEAHDGSTWKRLGGLYTAAPKATGENHAEMQWWKNIDSLSTKLEGVTQVVFHITEQPCAKYCAQRMIENWAPHHSAALRCYIRTYKDGDKSYTYWLTNQAILRL